MIRQNLSKIFAVILSFLQMLMFNVCCGNYTEPEKEETQIVIDISGDTSLADSIKFASDMSSVRFMQWKTPLLTFLLLLQ